MGRDVMDEKTLQNSGDGTMARAGRSPAAKSAFITAAAIVVAVLLGAVMVTPLEAQSYPNKPIRFILPFPPGGATDILGRIIGQKLSERLGQPVVPENRPGGAGNIGLEATANAKPDGYTIVLTVQTLAISPSLFKKLNYDPVKDFAPISLVGQIPMVLVTRPALPIRNLKELVAYAKANPQKLNYGSGGTGNANHLVFELLKNLTKIDIVHVPYKGVNQAMIGVMAGEVDMVSIGPPAALPHIQTGKVRALAVLQKERVPTLPDVPTSKEAGVENFEVVSWYGILAPAATPRDIVNRLNAEWIKIAAMPDTKEKMQSAGVEPLSSTPEQFADFIKTEIVRWSKVIKEANLSVD
ncbi:MAG: tripartite tricarboxylate transporter substrate binding protein [Deltaproteobacteria bacterium]